MGRFGHAKEVSRVLFVVPPFYRLLGSHNNRLLLSLHCLAEVIAERYGVEAKILNLDSESHESYASWPEIYEQSPYFAQRLENHVVWDELRRYLVELKPDIVVVGAGDLILPTVDFGVPAAAKRVGKIVDSALGNAATSYVYGVFPTLNPGEFFDSFGGVIVGEAEVEEVCLRLMRRETGLILGEPTQDLDKVPFLTKERLIVPVGNVNMDYIVSSRGCYCACSYCITPVVCQRHVRLMDVDRFVDEVQFRYNKYDLEAQYFADMNFLVPTWRSRAICQEIMCRRLKLRWWCEARADSVDEEICELFKEAGCSHLKIGVEGNDKVMRALGKTETEEIARRAVRIAKEAGLGVVCYVMLGAPGVSDAEFRRSYEFLKSLEAMHYVVNLTVPHLGTPLYAQVKSVAADDWQHLDARLREFWGLSEETVQMCMELNRHGRKEDSEIRRYGCDSVPAKV